ncbi:hypothetical protein TRAPUB_10157 [Trametes pubescens]|uniref:Transcription elongation factor Eaf N-terminal domain-containing protein n=1 Tax=Trametes pubescens TaxID=154538 RepID=A0A1M2W0K5_TRAPU|nr:hypothetical protein TRAPUB_10157 [Trametes pubescens]
MTSTASNAWMPTGRHEINIGTSLMRSLKARKGGPVKNSKAKPDREFYSFRYNFKPESVDPTKPGSIEIKAKEEEGHSSVRVTRPSTQNETGVNYVGSGRPAKDVDCVLIYDEELQTFTLEKIETLLTLQHDPRTVHAPRLANSPAPPVPQRAPAAAVREEEEESEGEIPEPAKSKPPSRLNASVVLPKTKPTTPVPQPAPRALPPSLPPKPVKSTPTPKPVQTPAPAKPAPVAASSKPAPATAPPKPRPRPIGTSAFPFKSANKRELPADAEETSTARRAVQPPPFKKAKVVPEKKEQPVALALPGAGASPALALPSASSVSASAQPPSLSLPTSSSIVTLPPAPAATIPVLDPAVAAITDSDEEEEWDEVQPTIAVPLAPAPAAAPPVPPLIVMEEIEPSAFTPAAGAADGEDLDDFMAAFEEELLEQLDDPDADMDADGDAEADDVDFLAGAMSPVMERHPQYPVADGEFGDDDYSSSDSSDED